MWQVFHNKLHTTTALKRRGWEGSPLCCVCDRYETVVNHILFQCVFSQYIWCCVRNAFGLQGFPTSIQDILHFWLPRRHGISRKISFIFFAGLAWSIWKNMNKMAIEKNFPTNSDAVIHAAIHYMQMWADLLKERDKLKLEQMATTLSDWMKNKPTYDGPSPDICVM